MTATTTTTIAASALTVGATIVRTRYPSGREAIATRHTVLVVNTGSDDRGKPAIVALCTGDRVFTLKPTELVAIEQGA